MKKITSALLCLILCFSLAFGALAAGVKITVDGVEVNQVNANGDPVPELEQEDFDTPVVPIRSVLNAMGYFTDYVDGNVIGGLRADPAISIPAENTVLVDGTAFVPYSILNRENGIDYEAEIIDGVISYTNLYSEIETGYYKISLDGKYLTAKPLPDEALVETRINEDGAEEEITTTPVQQVNGSQVYLSEDDGSDSQIWLARLQTNKKYTLINKATGLALDVSGWSTENGGKVIQYTLSGGSNQQWTFSETDDGYAVSNVYSKLALTNVGEDIFATGLDSGYVIQSSDKGVGWTLELIEPYTNPVELALKTDAYNELYSYFQERFKSYFFTDVDFSVSANSIAETYLRENGFAEADKETQQELIMSCLDLPYSSLLGGSMQNKLSASYTISEPEMEIIGEGEDEHDYYVYTVAMECNSPDDIHEFQVYTVDEDDLEHVTRVADAVACFEPPVRKTLRHFFYTGDEYGTWNAWDGEIWNNTGYKASIDGMLPMFAHELGHVIDSAFAVGDDVWRRAINKDIIPTSGYGQTNRWEDFGEFSRLYLLSLGNESRIDAIEKIYPNRTKTYRAALYNIDNEYYAEYKEYYDEVTAAIGDTSEIDGEMYYTIAEGLQGGVTPGGFLTNNNGVLTFEEELSGDNQLWQFSVEDEQCVKIFSKLDGTSVTVPNILPKIQLFSNSDSGTLFGIKTTKMSNGFYSAELTISETGFGIYAVASDESDADVLMSGDTQTFYLTPVEKVEGMGAFTIKSGDKYLVPSSEERGAQLVLSDSDEMSVWYVNKLPNNVGYITNVANDFAIDINGASEDEGAIALTYTLSRNANQMWLIIENDNGTVSLQAQHSGLYLAADEEGGVIQSSEKYEWTLEEAE